ncbi:MAG: Fic family protein [Alphaproteobacteria bacterium]
MISIWPPETGILDLEPNWPDLGASEMESIRAIWKEQQERLKGTRQLAEFREHLNREWAIETGIIENLYDLDRGVTQTLIERGFQAELIGHGATNKPRDHVIRLLEDQKDALEGVFDFVTNRRTLSVSYIKELHAALLRSQTHTDAVDPSGRGIEVLLERGAWKTQVNYPTRDGILYTYCPPEQVASEMDRLVALHLEHREKGVPADVQAAWLHHRFSQIHPFQDGNGRVARALASLVLIQAGLFPLVVTRDGRTIYLDALEKADQGDLKPLVAFFARLQRDQFRRATAISENLISATADVGQVLGGLLRAAERKQEIGEQDLKTVFNHARVLEDDIRRRLETISPDVLKALQRFTAAAEVSVRRSEEGTEHYYRSQIIETARGLHYFANTSEYRAWVGLKMAWKRKASLVFSFHGIGRVFNGSLVCAPFLEFRDVDGEGQTRSSIIPVADEAFVFFRNETEEKALSRFQPWRERVLVVALQELADNL